MWMLRGECSEEKHQTKWSACPCWATTLRTKLMPAGSTDVLSVLQKCKKNVPVLEDRIPAAPSGLHVVWRVQSKKMKGKFDSSIYCKQCTIHHFMTYLEGFSTRRFPGESHCLWESASKGEAEADFMPHGNVLHFDTFPRTCIQISRLHSDSQLVIVLPVLWFWF